MPAADLLDPDDLRPCAHPRAAAHHARKAHAVTAVVEPELHPPGSQQLRQEVVDERQGEEPVGDGAAERTLGGTTAPAMSEPLDDGHVRLAAALAHGLQAITRTAPFQLVKERR